MQAIKPYDKIQPLVHQAFTQCAVVIRHALLWFTLFSLLTGCDCLFPTAQKKSGAATQTIPERSLFFQGKSLSFKQTSGKVVGVYLPSYAIASGYDMASLPAANITHLLFGFIGVCGYGKSPEDNITCHDKQDFELAVNAESIDRTYYPYFVKLRQSFPNLQILFSIGGGSGSAPFVAMASDARKRTIFIDSVIRYLNSNPAYSGLDIDWESPTISGKLSESTAYIDLLRELRNALDQLGKTTGRQYLLVSAVNTGNYVVKNIDYKSAQQYVDLFFAMTYDYYGNWSNQVGHHTALYPDTATRGVANLLKAGVPASKLVQGVAMYSRGWGNCIRSPGNTTLTGNGNYNGRDGTEPYYKLAGTQLSPINGQGLAGYEVIYDASTHAYHLWNPQQSIWIGYDDPRAVAEKGRYAVDNHLAGIFAWEISQDNGDILNAMNYGIGNELIWQ